MIIAIIMLMIIIRKKHRIMGISEHHIYCSYHYDIYIEYIKLSFCTEK